MIRRVVKENKVAIYISISCGILLMILQPLLTFLFDRLINFIASICSVLSNHIYRLAAQNNPNLLDENIAMIVVLIMVFALLDYSCSSYRELICALSDLEAISSNKPKTVLVSNCNDVSAQCDLVKAKIKNRRSGMRGGIVFTLIFFIFMAWDINVSKIANRLNDSFQSKLVILSVYANDIEIKKLRAEWVQMKSAQDYKKIMATISEYEKSITLQK